MRRSGNTTRIIDRCVQELFKNGITYLHEGRGTDAEASMRVELFYRFKRRIDIEHPSTRYKHKLVDQDGVTCYKVEIVE